MTYFMTYLFFGCFTDTKPFLECNLYVIKRCHAFFIWYLHTKIMVFVGIDDTDSVNGMCTTYLASKICAELGISEIPKLIRLNPNIPYKTRGNGAVAFESKAQNTEAVVLSYVKKYAILSDEKTNPGVVFLESEIIPADVKEFYLKAVSELVTIEEAEEVAKKAGAKIHKFKNGRGIIGALAAIGFHGTTTFELIAYRTKKYYGRPRMIDKESVKKMDDLLSPNVFANLDSKKERIIITPKGLDPVFCGIRGLTKEAVESAWGMINPLEPIELTQVFETNHATDAHLREKTVSEIKPYDCVMVSGKISTNPHTLVGGHVFFTLSDETGSIDCAAYNKTGPLQDTILKLIEGDGVIACGGIGKYPHTLNLEKIYVNSLSELKQLDIPICCGKNMTSAGAGKGYKCKKCKNKVSQNNLLVSRGVRGVALGVYVAPAEARRHLTKPPEMS